MEKSDTSAAIVPILRDTSFQSRFQACLSDLHDALGDRRRRERFNAYCSGLIMNLERRSVESIAATLDPDDFSARHQSPLRLWIWSGSRPVCVSRASRRIESSSARGGGSARRRV